MSFGIILLIATGVLGGASLVSRIFRVGLEARDELGHLPFTSIAGAKAGPICVRGRARALGAPLVAPLSGRPALFFEIVVTVHGGATAWDDVGVVGNLRVVGSVGWNTYRRIGATSFEVDDGSGRVVVSIPPEGPPVGEGEPEILIALPVTRRERNLSGGRRDLEQLLGRPERGEPVSVVERIVAVDDVITVGGLAVRQVHPAGTREGVRDAPTSLVFEATREQPLVLVRALMDRVPRRA